MTDIVNVGDGDLKSVDGDDGSSLQDVRFCQGETGIGCVAVRSVKCEV